MLLCCPALRWLHPMVCVDFDNPFLTQVNSSVGSTQVMQDSTTGEPRYTSDAYELENFELPVRIHRILEVHMLLGCTRDWHV